MGAVLQGHDAGYVGDVEEWSGNVNVSAILQHGIKPADLDLLQIAQAAGGGGEAEMSELRAGEVGVGEIAGQGSRLQAVNRIAQRLVDGVPGYVDLVPGAVLEVAEGDLARQPGLLKRGVGLDEIGMVASDVTKGGVLVGVKLDREAVADPCGANASTAHAKRAAAEAIVVEHEGHAVGSRAVTAEVDQIGRASCRERGKISVGA